MWPTLAVSVIVRSQEKHCVDGMQPQRSLPPHLGRKLGWVLRTGPRAGACLLTLTVDDVELAWRHLGEPASSITQHAEARQRVPCKWNERLKDDAPRLACHVQAAMSRLPLYL
jgi:hypothetical protein